MVDPAFWNLTADIMERCSKTVKDAARRHPDDPGLALGEALVKLELDIAFIREHAGSDVRSKED